MEENGWCVSYKGYKILEPCVELQLYIQYMYICIQVMVNFESTMYTWQLLDENKMYKRNIYIIIINIVKHIIKDC